LPELSNDQLTDLLRRSQFVFDATVTASNRSTVEGVDADDHTVVAHVDRVLHSPAALARTAGTDVTVQLLPGTEVPAANAHLVLFTTALAYGEGIALAEVGRTDVDTVGAVTMAAGAPAVLPGARPGRPHPVLEASQALDDERLQQHASEADAVIVGHVVNLEDAGPPARSEHDPDWWRATIAVDQVEKGNVGATVSVLYPNSADVRWARVVKPRPGQHGLWMLHATTGAEAELAPFALLFPDDVHAPEQVERLGDGVH
jgi:hypothetical protein